MLAKSLDGVTDEALLRYAWTSLEIQLVLDSVEERSTPTASGPSLDEGVEKGRVDAGDASHTRLVMFAR